VIGWLLRRWQRRFPGPALAVSLVFIVLGTGLLCWWVLRDLARGQWMRPAIAVIALAFVSLRVLLSFKPHRQ
jgi:hypothetical protein